MPTVTLKVGKPRKLFHIHRNLLCEASPVFKAAFSESGRFSESESQTMDMDEDDATAFEVIAKWLYTNKCELSEQEINDTGYTARLATFEGWSPAAPTAESLAACGFARKPLPRQSPADRVECTGCSQALCDWLPGDDPIAEHLKWKPNCMIAIQAQEALDPPAQDSHSSEPFLMQLATVYATAEKFGILKLKNDLIDLLFRFRRADSIPKPPSSNTVSYFYSTTPPKSPLRKIFVAWYTWHVNQAWYGHSSTPDILSEMPDFAADLACSMALKNGGLPKSSPLDSKSYIYHEVSPQDRTTSDNDMEGMNKS